MKIVYHTLLHTSRVLGAPAVFLLLLLAITTTTHAQERPFITTWSDDVDEEGIPITIRLDGAFTYDFEYTLKDAQGSIVKSDRHTSGDGDFVITLPVRGATYTLEITGAFPRLFDYPKDRLLDVNQWGDIAWGSMRESFQDWPGEEFSAADAPDLSGVRDMSGMFSYYNIDEFTFNGDLSSWDVSNVTDMTYMFLNAESFNGDVRSWDVSNVTDMEGMFYSASAFNGNLSSWDVSNVTNMQFMFYNARAFNGNLGSWDISSVTNMIEMLDISGLSPASYDSLLIGWAGQQVQQNVELGARGLAFCEGRAAREVLTSAPNNWQIADEGRGIACPFNEAVSFITTWQATEADRQIRIPLDGRQAYDFLFEWRDDRDSVVASGHRTSGTWVTTLPDAGVYTLMIDGAFPRFAGYDKAQLLDVNQWGKIAWKSMQNSFGNWSGTGFSATDVPDLSEVIHMGGAFQRTSNFTGGDLDRWDVSEVINMEFMFDGAVSFNDDISGWDVSNVTTMEAMFRDAKAFDQNLGGWNIGRVENMNAMLRNTALSIAHYDSLLIGWERQEVRPNVPFGAFGLLYCEGEEARNRLTSAPNNWSMVDRGQRCVDDPSALFITTWQTTENNQTIRIPLDTAFTYNFDYVWRNARSGSVQEGSHTSEDGDFRITLSAEGTYLLEITGAFPRFVGYPKARLQDVNQWGNIAWGSMRESFEDWPGERFSAADTPDLSEVTDMRAMFDDASSFNGDVSNWDVSNVTDMREIFRDASSFNGDISSWDVSNVTNMSRMFSGAEAFNGEVSRWDVSNVTNMSRMFSGAEAFNGEVSRWDVSSVTDMLGMFSSVSSFNQDLSSWDVSGVTNMSFMFRNATSFNQPLNNWDVSSVTNMFRMFHQASTFNQPLNNWDVSSVRDMEEMFHIAEQFNQPLDNWDVSSVTDMEEMFNRAEQFNQPLNTWNIGQVSDMTGMLFGSRLSRSNYDRTLIGWTQQPVQQNVELGAGERTFCAGEEARNVLRREKDWTIKNDEKDCGPTYSALVAFTVPGQTGRTTFNDPGRTARAEVEPGTDLSALAPVLTIPPGATSSPGVRQTVDFTVPVTYTITAPNGTTTQEWTVEVVEETVPPLLITREVDDPGYHMLSAPASGPLFDELLHGFWTQGLTGGDREDGFPILYTWDAENQTWVAMGDLATEPLVPGQGFMFYVYPDDNGPGVPGGTEFPKLLTSERFVEDENVEMNAGDIPAITDLGDGAFFLAGNPYWETIDWNKLEKTGLSESFYVYDPSINGYRVCNSGSILCDVTLAPYQGFFVEGFGGDGSLTFTEEAIVDEEPAEEVLAKTNPKKKDTQLEARMLGLVANTEGRISEAWVSFQDGGKPGRDVYDGLTLASLDTTYLQLFTLTEEHQALTINVLPPEPEKEYRLPLELAGRGFGETAELTFTGLEAFEGWDITLVDIETGQEYDITSGDTLTVHIEPGQVPAKAKGSLGTATPQAVKTSTSRYELVLVSPGYEEGADGPELPTEVALSQNYPNPFNPATIIKYALPGRSDVRLEVYDIVGRKVATLVNGEPQSAGRYEVRFDASTLASGMYLYRLETLSAGGTGGNKILVRKMMLIK